MGIYTLKRNAKSTHREMVWQEGDTTSEGAFVEKEGGCLFIYQSIGGKSNVLLHSLAVGILKRKYSNERVGDSVAHTDWHQQLTMQA